MAQSDITFRLQLFAHGLKLGILKLPDMVSFVDGLIRETENPDAVLIDLSLSATIDQAVTSLNQYLEDKPIPDDIGYFLLNELGKQLESKSLEPRTFISKAVNVAWNTELNRDIKQDIDQLDDNYFQASEGFGNLTEAETVADILKYFERFKKYEIEKTCPQHLP
jgi:hypothetical protein